MDVKFSLVFRPSAGAATHAVFDWFEERHEGAATISLAEFKALSASDQNALSAGCINNKIAALGPDTRLPFDVYCAGVCHSRIHAAGTLAPGALHCSTALRATSYLWDVRCGRMRGEELVAVYCAEESCIMSVRLYFRDRSRTLRVDHPEAVTRRHCVVCRASDTVEEPFKRCARCHIPVYCSRKCQTKDWAMHKAVCAKI